MADETIAGAQDKTKPRKQLNPRRAQSLLYEVEQALQKDRKEPKLTAREKIGYLNVGAKLAKILSEGDKGKPKEPVKPKDSRAIFAND